MIFIQQQIQDIKHRFLYFKFESKRKWKIN